MDDGVDASAAAYAPQGRRVASQEHRMVSFGFLDDREEQSRVSFPFSSLLERRALHPVSPVATVASSAPSVYAVRAEDADEWASEYADAATPLQPRCRNNSVRSLAHDVADDTRSMASSTTHAARSDGTDDAASVASMRAPPTGADAWIRRFRGEGISRRYWMADETAKACRECTLPFTQLRRRHHCRICGQIFCSRCAPHIIPGARFGHQGRLRICDPCRHMLDEYGHRERIDADARVASRRTRRSSSVSSVLTSAGVRAEADQQPARTDEPAQHTPPSQFAAANLFANDVPRAVDADAHAPFRSTLDVDVALGPPGLVHFLRMLHQLLVAERLGDVQEWKETIKLLALSVIERIRMRTRTTALTDIRDFVKIKCIPGGRIADCEFLDGYICTKNVATRAMDSLLPMYNARIMIVAFPLEYHRNASQLMSLEPVIAQEAEFIRILVARILALRPNVVIAEKSVSHLALRLFEAARVLVFWSMKPSAVASIARCTHADTVASIDRLALEPRLGRCALLSVDTYECVHARGRRKPLLRIEVTARDAGSGLVLRGAPLPALRRVKAILALMVYVGYNLKLEEKVRSDLGAVLDWSVVNMQQGPAQVYTLRDDVLGTDTHRKVVLDATLHKYQRLILSASITVVFPLPFLVSQMKLVSDRMHQVRERLASAAPTGAPSGDDAGIEVSPLAPPGWDTGIEAFPERERLGKDRPGEASLVRGNIPDGRGMPDDAAQRTAYSSATPPRSPGTAPRSPTAASSAAPARAASPVAPAPAPPVARSSPPSPAPGNPDIATPPPPPFPTTLALRQPCTLRDEAELAQLSLERDAILHSWNPCVHGMARMLTPFAHQQLTMLTWTTCTATEHTCTGPAFHTVEYYAPDDEPLGQVLERTCQESARPCAAQRCGSANVQHVRTFVHNSVRIQMVVEQFPCPVPGEEEELLCWSYCKACAQTTQVTCVSDETWSYSFAKYLEVQFYPNRACRAAQCPHDYFGDGVRYFAYQNLVIRFHADAVVPWELVAPPARLLMHADLQCELKNEEAIALFVQNRQYWQSVRARLDALQRALRASRVHAAVPALAASRVRALALLARLHSCAYADCVAVQKLLAAVYWDAGLDLLRLSDVRRCLQDKVVAWDGGFLDLEKHPTQERDTRRAVATHLKRLYADRDVAGGGGEEAPGKAAEAAEGGGEETEGERVKDGKEGERVKEGKEVDRVRAGTNGAQSTGHADARVDGKEGCPSVRDTDTERASRPDGDSERLSDKEMQQRPAAESKHPPGPDSPRLRDTSQRSPGGMGAEKHAAAPPSPWQERTRPATLARGASSTDMPGRSLSHAIAPDAPSGAVSRSASHTEGKNVTRGGDVGRASKGGFRNAPSPSSLAPPFPTSFALRPPPSAHGKDHRPRASADEGLRTGWSQAYARARGDPPSRTQVTRIAHQFDRLSHEADKERERQRHYGSRRRRPTRVATTTHATVEVFKNLGEAVRGDESDEDPERGAAGADGGPDGDGDGGPEDGGDGGTARGAAGGPARGPDREPAGGLSGGPGGDADGVTDVDAAARSLWRAPAEHGAATAAPSPSSPTAPPPAAAAPAAPSSPPPHLDPPADPPTDALNCTALFAALADTWTAPTGEAPVGELPGLLYPFLSSDHVFADSPIVVREEEPSSIIAFTLSTASYREQLRASLAARTAQDADAPRAADSAERRRVLESALRDAEASHYRYVFDTGSVKLWCKIFFAEQFDALRHVHACGDTFVQSLARCVKWDSQGGKSRSGFLKTRDDRFIMKELSRAERDGFAKFAPQYFAYLADCHAAGRPTALCRIFGYFRVGFRNAHTGRALKMDIVVMENLVYGHAVVRLYDLKGSTRNRRAPETGRPSEVLLDENLVHTSPTAPLLVREHSKRLLRAALFNDSLFLTSMNVMDYSLIVALDDARNELVIGIIDYLRTYTWDKRVESFVKETAILGGGGRGEPTIITPRQYRTRFLAFLDRYFLMTPDPWTQPGWVQ
ncbi:1-phosphatidylinositol-3-phosphate 5-kinase [Malassezia sp. CBS 17886]|nr:1-phosphatidylinositol-3-phosphate 5-kinase [Malassezia sp. CBS 17886]